MDQIDITHLLKSFRTETMGFLRTPRLGSFGHFTEPLAPHKASFREAPREPVGAELARRFDFIVRMNDQRTCEKGKSMATFGLCGCIGGYIENQTSNTLFHYDPTSTLMIDRLVSQRVTRDTTKVHFFVPGDWEKDSNGKYQMQPNKEYTDRFLFPALNFIKAMGVEVEFHCYSKAQSCDALYQGTAWINSDGKLFAEGMLIKSCTRPLQSDSGTPSPSSAPEV